MTCAQNLIQLPHVADRVASFRARMIDRKLQFDPRSSSMYVPPQPTNIDASAATRMKYGFRIYLPYA